ncbi:MAG: right-handed parallel beta-helix repeat-containing protein [Candidatus Coatesbacteria bacterium]|nr:right-handed parallel beta-helix repeat-containing protein [Candidatus Coatesbacteria bacterium]
MKMRIVGGIAVAIVVSAILPAAAVAVPQVFIYTDKASYQAGDVIQVSLAGQNLGEGMSVDVYIGLLTPDGGLWTLGELLWSEGIEPWIEGIYVPSGFSMDRRPLFWFDLPCDTPSIPEPGEYSFASVLTAPGTTGWVSEAHFAAFDVEPAAGLHFYVSSDFSVGSDRNDGSEDAPWRTITHALASVEGSEATPVTIHVGAGIYYDEDFSLQMKSWVSLLAQGPGATLDAGEDGTSVISCEDVQGVTIRGFTITGGGPDSDGLSGVKFGGGIFCRGSSVLIVDNTITDNCAGWVACGGGGGGIYCTGGSPVIVSNLIILNTAQPSCSAEGGGIFCENSAAIIANNTIMENVACYGGGIAIWGCANAGPAQIFNNMIVDNAGYGSGISGRHVVDTVVVDCIVWAPDDDHVVLYSVSASYCCIKGGYPGEGNIDQDPMLVADSPWPGWTGWKRYLDPGSPCIDAGSRSAEDAGLSGMTTQEDGTPDTGTVDMGVHYPIPRWSP